MGLKYNLLYVFCTYATFVPFFQFRIGVFKNAIYAPFISTRGCTYLEIGFKQAIS